MSERYFIAYGCYLGMAYEVENFASLEDAEQYASEMAYQETSGWVGMHGFCDEPYEDFESEEDYEAYIEEETQHAAEGYVEVYDAAKHDGYL